MSQETSRPPSSRADAIVAATAMATLFALVVVLGLRGLLLLGAHNHYLELVFIILILGAPVSWLLARRTAGGRGRWLLFGAISLSALAFVALRPLPVTTIEMELDRAPMSAELMLAWPTDEGDTAHVTDTIARGDAPARAVFLLPRPIRERRPAYTLHLGEVNGTWDIRRLSYGTDFLGRHVPLAHFRGETLFQVISGTDSLNRLSLQQDMVRLRNTAGAKASLSVVRDREVLHEHLVAGRVTFVRGAWLALYLLLAAAVSWPASLARVTRPATSRLQHHLTT